MHVYFPLNQLSNLPLVCQIWQANPTVHVHFQITTCLTLALILAPLTDNTTRETNTLQSGVQIRHRPVSVLWISVQRFISLAEPLKGSPLLSITPCLQCTHLSLMYTNIFPCKSLQYQHVLEQKANRRLKNKSAHTCTYVLTHTKIHIDSLCKCHKRLQRTKRGSNANNNTWI